MMGIYPQRRDLTGLPTPKQAAIRRGRHLESLANAQALNPEDFPAFTHGDQKPATFIAWDSGVREQVLQFCRSRKANRLKAIARLPVAENNAPADAVSIKNLAPRLS